MFGFGRKAALGERVRREIHAIGEMCEREGGVDAARFWGDPYLVGYANGVHSVLASDMNDVKLSTLEKGRMWMDAVEANQGRASEVLPRMDQWAIHNEEFERGAAEGINTKLLQLSKLPAPGYDDDIRWAIGQAAVIQSEAAQNPKLKPPDVNSAASVALAHRYISRHLDRQYR